MGPMSLPPGFRFHPTDDELVGYYLKRKVDGQPIELEVIPVIDLYKFEPWELPDKSFLPKRDMEWFFFCPRDRKYPNGSRTNRATGSGYWKATGKDRKVMCETSIYGLRKTLVFYRGRAPGGERTEWVMHEYRLCEDLSQATPNFVGAFALCRVAKRSEHGQKNNDLQDEPKAKRSHSNSMSGFGLRKYIGNPSNTKLSISDGPIPSENGSNIELEPIVTNTDHTSFWLPNVISATAKTIQLKDSAPSEPLVTANLSNSASASSLYDLSPVSSYSNLTVEDYLTEDFTGDVCLSSFPSPLHGMGLYRNDEYMGFQSLEWNPTQLFPPPSGMDAWNTMVPPICRQSSEGEEANLWLQAW
uniref:NAC protein n=1 Tax=Lilium pumilum TaxID=82327 RepID=A0A4Y1NZY6_9LILI|nr:NAC protein [Lilium pumilum]